MVAARSKYQIIHHHDVEAKESIGRGKGGSADGKGRSTDGGTVTSRQKKSKSNRDSSTEARSVDGLPQFHIGTSSAPKLKGRSRFAIKSHDRRSMKASKSEDSRNNRRSTKASKSKDTKIKSGPSAPLLVVIDGSNVAFGFDEIVSKPQFSLKGVLLALQVTRPRPVLIDSP